MTVQALTLRLLQRIDPFLKATGVEISASNIATWGTDGGDKFTAQRIVDIINDSRFALFEAYRAKFGEGAELSRQVGEQLVSTTITFSSAAAKTTATKPTGYARFSQLSSSADVPYIMLPITLLNEVRIGNNLDYKQTATNAFVFDEGTTLASYGTVGVNSGNTYIAGSGVKIVYYGITSWAVSDVTGGSTVESFNDKDIPKLLELAQAIAKEHGGVELNALATKLIGA